jgi:aminopeptidase
MLSIYEKYASLLVNYCLELKEGETVYVKSTFLAEPLLKAFYKEALKAGAHPHFAMDFEDKEFIFLENARDFQLEYVSPVYQHVMENFDAYLVIRAPFNLKDLQQTNPTASKRAKAAKGSIMQTYMERTASRAMKRNLCQFPTSACAQEAGMSLTEYEKFVYDACYLYDDEPVEKWMGVRKSQQHIVDLLNGRQNIRYRAEDFDISFRTEGRIWMNSDGQTNMPSGEVYTSPLENSVNGTVRFSYPGIFMGREIEDIILWVKDGEVQKWEAKRGGELLDQVFSIPGAKRFGEAAIGTNNAIQTFTKNMLFDEKMGGTIHMALGQSYLQTGGKNNSNIHWDLLANMRDGGEIYADDELIYKGGEFIV